MMSEPVLTLFDLQLLLTALLVGVSLFLHRRVRESEFYRWWIWAWGALGFTMFLLVLPRMVGLSPEATARLRILVAPGGLLQASFFLLSALSLRTNTRLRRRTVATVVVLAIVVGTTFGLLAWGAATEGAQALDQAFRTFPRQMALGVVLPLWAVIFVRSRHRLGAAGVVTALGMAAYGLNQSLYGIGSGTTIVADLLGTGANGLSSYINSSGAYLLDIGTEAIIGIGAGLTLVEEAIRTERRLGAVEHRLATVVDNSSDFIAFGSANGEMEFVNRAGLEMVGLSDAGDFEGRRMTDFVDPGLADDLLAETRPALREVGRWQGETALRRFDDHSRVPVDASVFLIHDRGTGSPIATATICRDVTERKAHLLQLNDAKEAAESANRAKSEFLATMSHEIRTPLNAIIGMAELLGETGLSDQQRDYVQVFRTAGDTLLRLINEVLDLSKIEAGRLELDPRGFDPRELIDDTLQVFAVPAHARGLEIAGHVAPEVPEWVVGDPERIRQVLVNLLGNALKFTDEGEVAVHVTVEEAREEADDVTLRFSVRDTGSGIASDQLRRVFERFTQADSSSTRRHGGTGLGLAISAALAELMGGELSAESELGVGSTFFFTADLLREEAPEARKEPAPMDVTGLRVLVVDDNATNRLILQETIGGWGGRVRAYADGSSAIEALRRSREGGAPFDLVLLDSQMPSMDGFEVARRIREEPALSTTTVLMLTSAGGHPGDVQRARELGIRRYLVKPIRRARLLGAIRDALGGLQEAAAPVREVAESVVGRRILLVEDAEENRLLVNAYLKKSPHQLRMANDGREAVDAFTSDPDAYDLILMDVQMPVMDGYEATRTIRAWEHELERRPVPIVALTAHALASEKEKSLEAGCDLHLTKPIKKQRLLDAIDEFALTPDLQESAGADARMTFGRVPRSAGRSALG